MKLAIIIATYQRKDNTTPEYLTRALNSIKSQIYQDYHIYLIGDQYEDNNEFIQLSNIIPSNQITAVNLPIAVERERYPQGGVQLWRCGGANAVNYGIELALADGYYYHCRLDHDDYWSSNHLLDINTIIESHSPAFIYTKSEHIEGILPKDNHPSPRPYQLVHSSVCLNNKILPFRYRDTEFEIGIPDAADADMWKRISTYLEEHNLLSYHINKVTCYHLVEHQNQ
jgi:glycosyltransferase involved in cell wall biosynthesis